MSWMTLLHSICIHILPFKMTIFILFLMRGTNYFCSFFHTKLRASKLWSSFFCNQHEDKGTTFETWKKFIMCQNYGTKNLNALFEENDHLFYVWFGKSDDWNRRIHSFRRSDFRSCEAADFTVKCWLGLVLCQSQLMFRLLSRTLLAPIPFYRGDKVWTEETIERMLPALLATEFPVKLGSRPVRVDLDSEGVKGSIRTHKRKVSNVSSYVRMQDWEEWFGFFVLTSIFILLR